MPAFPRVGPISGAATIDVGSESPLQVEPMSTPSRDQLSVYLDPRDLEALANSAADSGAEGQLRIEAAIAWIIDPSCSTIAEMSRNPKFAGRVTMSRLSEWRGHDRWDALRRKFFAAYLTELTRTAGDEIIAAKRAELRQLRDLREIALEKLRNGTAKPKSWEGVAEAFVKISDRMDNVMDQVSARLEQAVKIKGQLEAEGEAEAGAHDPDEIAEVLRKTLAERREQQRAKALGDGEETT